MARPPSLPRGSPLRRRLLRLYDALRRRFGPPGPIPGSAVSRLGSVRRRLERRQGRRLRHFLRQPAPALRAELVGIAGIGPRTADAVLLHAAGRPVFVADTATRRVLERHRILRPNARDGELQALLMNNLPRDPALFHEYHALLVRVAQEYCRATPHCAACPLRPDLRGRPPAPPRARKGRGGASGGSSETLPSN
ncbi:MAG TPA: hypothetical protein VGW35_08910 [Methylomirabilota bacterium]|nr:hypothetical protein [Methylomirabilota bacterium]